MPVGNREYLSSGGSKCPWCGSEELGATGQIEIDGHVGHQPVRCYTCEKEWDDEWKLVGYESLWDGEGVIVQNGYET